jgi:N-acetylglutamate synthase-like GNAT family acetyltransferase
MTLDLEIKLLSECPEHISLLAQLWFDEIGKPWIPNANVEHAEQIYREHTNHDKLPLTFVAIYDNKPIAMASLRTDDGLGDKFSPWFGSLIVHPDYREQGVGETLIDFAKWQAKHMGYRKLHLLALDPTLPNWYTKLGWKYVGMDKLYHHPVTVMAIDIE